VAREREHAVTDESDVAAARVAARELAAELGFPRVRCHEMAVVASELASNIVKYGVRGALRVEEVIDAERGRGIRITAVDEGPPFHDFAMACRDGFDDKGPLPPALLVRRRGIGAGLGAVQRLSDEMGWERTEGGKRIWATRYLAPPRGTVRGS
jgi:anti-sigma regulatory factor (Ser/Thr protein kinase)